MAWVYLFVRAIFRLIVLYTDAFSKGMSACSKTRACTISALITKRATEDSCKSEPTLRTLQQVYWKNVTSSNTSGHQADFRAQSWDELRHIIT
jgi:hypothetical protein